MPHGECLHHLFVRRHFHPTAQQKNQEIITASLFQEFRIYSGSLESQLAMGMNLILPGRTFGPAGDRSTMTAIEDYR